MHRYHPGLIHAVQNGYWLRIARFDNRLLTGTRMIGSQLQHLQTGFGDLARYVHS